MTARSSPEVSPEAAPPLLARVARGEALAVKECIERYGGLVWAMARRLAPNEADDAAPERGAEAAIAARALDQLRPEQRDVLLLSTCQGLSHDEIAQKTGMPLGTV